LSKVTSIPEMDNIKCVKSLKEQAVTAGLSKVRFDLCAKFKN